MAGFLRPFESQAYAAFRIVTGLLFLWHGCQKLFGFPAPVPEAPAFVLYVGGSIELVGGFLVTIGLFAGWAAFLCSGMMAFAYWMAHGSRIFEQGATALFPLNNGGELAALYCFAFLLIAARGSGIWSVDASRPA